MINLRTQIGSELDSGQQDESARVVVALVEKGAEMRTRGLMMLLAGLAAAVGAIFFVASSASASDWVKMKASVNPDGTGRLFARTGTAPWFWEACRPNLASCAPFGKRDRTVEKVDAPPGTIFRVESEGSTGVSPEWRGRVMQVESPSVEGVIRANEFVSPVPGTWGGGWAGEMSQVQLAACITPEGQGCTTLTDLHYLRRCSPSSSFVLDARFTGQYLRVAERRVGAGPLFEPAYGVTSPNVGEVWGRSRITSAAIVGQIAPAASPYSGECGPPPPGRASISKQGVALVECPGGCRAALIGSRKGRRAQTQRNLSEYDALTILPPTRLRLPLGKLTGAGAGNVRLVVKLDGEQVAQRTIRPGASNSRHVR